MGDNIHSLRNSYQVRVFIEQFQLLRISCEVKIYRHPIGIIKRPALLSFRRLCRDKMRQPTFVSGVMV